MIMSSELSPSTSLLHRSRYPWEKEVTCDEPARARGDPGWPTQALLDRDDALAGDINKIQGSVASTYDEVGVMREEKHSGTFDAGHY